MAVGVDEAGADGEPGAIDLAGLGRRRERAHFRDAIARDEHVAADRRLARPVENRAVAQQNHAATFCFGVHSVISSVLASTRTPPTTAGVLRRSPSQMAAIGTPKNVIR